MGKHQLAGSCAAHAAATVKEIQERKDYGLTEKLSTRFVYAQRCPSCSKTSNGHVKEGMGAFRVYTVL